MRISCWMFGVWMVPSVAVAGTTTGGETPEGSCSGAVEIDVSSAFPALTKPSAKSLKALTIPDAQAYAKSANVCRLDVELFAGVYADAVKIDRQTRLFAAPGLAAPTIGGSITNSGGYTLSITGIAVVGAKSVGVSQVGGELTLDDVEISDTYASKGGGGVGLDVSGGAQVSMDDVLLAYNDGGGAHIHGTGTQVIAYDLDVFANRITGTPTTHPDAAAVAVYDRAEAYLDGAAIDGNTGIGLLSEGSGSAVHFRSGYVADAADGGAGVTGVNAAALDGGELALYDFTITGAEQIGLIEIDAHLAAEDGVITGNLVGYSNTTSGMVSCLAETLLFDNDVDQDFSEIGLPDVTCALDPESCVAVKAVCAEVPWP